VPVENALGFFAALRRANVPAELHVYESGRHGVGLAPTDPTLRSWPDRLEDWLRRRQILPPRPEVKK
jgi:dipeptidyl aminopeptidase/acylaminoacyl peptidase